ncbi:ubiquitin--protein ligase [Teladorsagia circumcincta]|uniref:Ubiquitin--protein ligase n=1 Tax=Teladorsagia circumcincta TaxID=45464 RepID=A0A2G9UPG3_TELCI|nr:ubiquitin--protein ligase [Teladorsagia circumcincta]
MERINMKKMGTYPYAPPKCAFLTTGEGNVRFNPNLYNDGKICLSILGTWEGRPEEKWNSYCSLMQVLISIQGLIFVKEPYFNEPGFEKYQGTEKGDDCSKKYNLQVEHATLNYAIRAQLENPPHYFKERPVQQLMNDLSSMSCPVEHCETTYNVLIIRYASVLEA